MLLILVLYPTLCCNKSCYNGSPSVQSVFKDVIQKSIIYHMCGPLQTIILMYSEILAVGMGGFYPCAGLILLGIRSFVQGEAALQ